MSRINFQLDADALEALIQRVAEVTIARLADRVGAVDKHSCEREVATIFLLKPREAAKALGISERKLWDLTHRGEIPHVRVDRAVRYDPCDLREWVRRMKRGTQKEEPNGEHLS